VVADDDRAVGFHEESRTVGEADARASVRLCLDRVAGIKLSLAAGENGFASGSPHDLHIALERDETSAGRVFHLSHMPERIAVFPDVHGGACGEATEHENGDYQIDETLLDNPPIKSKMTGFIPNHWLNRLVEGLNKN